MAQLKLWDKNCPPDLIEEQRRKFTVPFESLGVGDWVVLPLAPLGAVDLPRSRQKILKRLQAESSRATRASNGIKRFHTKRCSDGIYRTWRSK